LSARGASEKACSERESLVEGTDYILEEFPVLPHDAGREVVIWVDELVVLSCSGFRPSTEKDCPSLPAALSIVENPASFVIAPSQNSRGIKNFTARCGVPMGSSTS